MAEGKKLAVLYAAKSSPDEKGSISDQLREAREWALANGYEIVGEYSEEDVSAYKGDRGEELARALEHAERVGATLIAQHSDRLARGDAKQARHLVEIALWAIKADVEVYCLQDPTTFQNLVMAVVMGERNMEDSKRKSLAVRGGLARRRRRGLFNGGSAPYGFALRRNEEDELRLVVDHHRAEVVRRIFDEYLAGRSLMAIAKALDADGIPTTKGRFWHFCTIRQILMNPAYAGLIRDGEDLIDAQHEAIVSPKTWEAAEALRKAKTRTHKRGRNPLGKHLFRKGFLRCGECGWAMVPRTRRMPNGNLYEEYCCGHRPTGAGPCQMSSLKRAKVDDAVYAYFEGLDLDIEATREQMASATERKLAEARELHEEARLELEESEARLRRVKGDYINGDLTAEEWRGLRTELELDFAKAKAKAKRFQERLRETEEGTALLETQEEVLRALSEIRRALAKEIIDANGAAAARAVLMRLFDGFVLRGEGPETGHLELAGNGRWIEPLISEHVVEGYADGFKPAFSQASQAGQKKFVDPIGRQSRHRPLHFTRWPS